MPRLRILTALLCLSPCAVRGTVPPDVAARAEPTPPVLPAPPPATPEPAAPEPPPEPEELEALGTVEDERRPEPLEALGYLTDEPTRHPPTRARGPVRTSHFTAFCEAGCSTSPYAALSPPPAPLALPAELAVRRLSIRVRPGHQRVELFGELHATTVELLAPVEPLTFQVYTTGAVWRCTLPADVSGVVSTRWKDHEFFLHPSGTPCERVGDHGFFSVGEVLPFPPAQVDDMLTAARADLQPAHFASDSAVTRYLRNDPRYRLGPAEVWRRGATSTAQDTVVVSHLDLPGVVLGPRGTYLCELCEFDTSLVGPLRVEGTVTMLGARADSYCARWDAPGEETFALRVDGRLTTTWPAVGGCRKTHPYGFDIARVPFESPPLPPWIPQPQARHTGPAPAPPDAATGSIPLLGAWIAASESDSRKRAKAVHDWIALNVRYDGPAYVTKVYPSQDAETVFRTKKGVCAGYSNLFVALARASGLEAVYLTGEAVIQGRLESHAWNAVRVDHGWELLDVTWDAGSLDGDHFTAQYETDWLFADPESFVATHVTDDPAWQLVPEPWTPEEALERPVLGDGLVLVSPRTSKVVTSQDSVQVVVQGPEGARPGIAIRPRGGGAARPCESVGHRSIVHGACALPTDGDYVVEFSSRGEYSGQIAVSRWP